MKDWDKILGSLLDQQKVAFLSSVDGDGFPVTRAMLMPRLREGIHTIWFSTNTSSGKVFDYRKNPKACVYFCDQRQFCGVGFVGTMEVLEDAQSKEMLWEAGDELYYSGGVTDPDYCVLKFTALKGRYYSSFKTEAFVVK